MAYEGHIAGLGDRPPGKRLQGRVIEWLQSRSAREIRARRAAVVAAVSELADLEFVNGGGTGSLHGTTAEDAVTELAAGLGLLRPHAVRRLQLVPPAARGDVRDAGRAQARARRSRPCSGGGYLGSGLGEPSRVPSPYLPAGLQPRPLRGRGRGPDAGARRAARVTCAIGDRVYFRHAKAGELCERFETLHLVSGDRVVDEVPTYRGEGKTFL